MSCAPLTRHLLEALVLGVVAEADGADAARDGGRLVVGGVGDGEPVARGQLPFTFDHRNGDRLFSRTRGTGAGTAA